MADKITVNNLFTETRTNVIDIIKANVIDPNTNTLNSRRRWIFRTMPDTTSTNFSGFPILVIPGNEIEDEFQDLQQCTSDTENSVDIEIYTEFTDEKARIDTIVNSLYAAFRKYSVKQTLLQNNMEGPNITLTPPSNQMIDKNKTVTRTMTLEFGSTITGE